VRDQGRVDPVLQPGALADEVKREAGPFPLRADGRVGQPDRWHEVAAGELGQHPGVDAVGLAGQRRQPLGPAGRRRSRPRSRPARAGRGRSGRRSSTRSRPAPAARSRPADRPGGRARRGRPRPPPASISWPPSPSAWKLMRLRLRSNPTYNIPLGLLVRDPATTRACRRGGPSSWHSFEDHASARSQAAAGQARLRRGNQARPEL
jgi:hypothetical protein